DSFTYRTGAGQAQGNVATVPLTVTPAETRLLPDTPYVNFLRARRRSDPARFDSYHPLIGAILSLATTGDPTPPTRLLHASHRPTVTAARALLTHDPGPFAARQPILGALFQLESPGAGPPPTHLLPASPHFNGLRADYERDPDHFDRGHIDLGAIFALE